MTDIAGWRAEVKRNGDMVTQQVMGGLRTLHGGSNKTRSITTFTSFMPTPQARTPYKASYKGETATKILANS
ncbi:hypothetical protein GCM10027343_24490 [Noviherbaspirillum agri]